MLSFLDYNFKGLHSEGSISLFLLFYFLHFMFLQIFLIIYCFCWLSSKVHRRIPVYIILFCITKLSMMKTLQVTGLLQDMNRMTFDYFHGFFHEYIMNITLVNGHISYTHRCCWDLNGQLNPSIFRDPLFKFPIKFCSDFGCCHYFLLGCD